MKNELSYKEYKKLTNNRERELDLILRAHGIIISVSQLKSLYKCLNLFFPNGTIEITKMLDIIDKMEILTKEKVKKIRNK